MATINSITPFPADIDRNYFGAWLSGFTDGEGSFQLGFEKTRPVAKFTICLRSDDISILNLIRSFFNCGLPVYECKKVYGRRNRVTTDRESPTARYTVKNIESLHDIIVPHFTWFPLMAKKANDFLIWKEAITFLYNRSTEIRHDSRGRRVRGHHTWYERDLLKFSRFITSLIEIRKFNDQSSL